ncbi:hypothetical protein EOD41_16935 [Mucilaginibacter limnophilus]|uniref:ABC-three component systems C-terminal domain-containing protein n=1 Tax=Mucilaginibacter limnophilus TaxID=1932778 RepID=A0A3S2V0B4_9SPHI|nr:ABC-three component system protein [Mucilaginibacter limnophilus]RVT98473.1 hypothetical protein EOD41_16935 [Mucilaginibacter limnophilus]
MISNAPTQLLGYAVQFPRALLHLLRGGPGDAVSVEVIGDVATHHADGSASSEEDKTSTVGNPLTDRSTDLWKTFYNWLKAIDEGSIVLDKTRFYLYTNQSGREAIVHVFDKAATTGEAKAALATARTTFADISESHEIWPYLNFVLSYDPGKLAELLTRFELQVNDGLGFNEIQDELERLLIGKHQRKFVTNLLSGWLQEEIMSKIALKQPALIPWEDYQKQFAVYFDRARKLELVDFALENPPTDDLIRDQVKIQPRYLQQLSHIRADEDEIVEAVTDFLRAKTNRDKWIENEIINEDIAIDFEEKLTGFWNTQQKMIALTERTREEHERGQLLFLNCKIRQEMIRDMSPPNGTIAGTYHALVEGKSLGWHPRWDAL